MNKTKALINFFDIFHSQSSVRKNSQLNGDNFQFRQIEEIDLCNLIKMCKSHKNREKNIKQQEIQSEAKPLNDNRIKNDEPLSFQRKQSSHSKASMIDVVKDPLYKIYSNDQSLIKLPPNYETTDLDMKIIIDLMNEPIDKKTYTEIVREETCKIYKKQIEGLNNALIRSLYLIPYPKDIIFEAIANIDLRKKWDDSFIELRNAAINQSNGAEVLYLSVKSPSIVLSERDFVQQRKIWNNFPNEHSCLLHFKSIEHPSCPVNPKYVRAETIISGFYIQDDLTKPCHSIFGIISQTDIKGNIPTWVVNNVTPKASKNWIKNLCKGCEMVLLLKK